MSLGLNELKLVKLPPDTNVWFGLVPFTCYSSTSVDNVVARAESRSVFKAKDVLLTCKFVLIVLEKLHLCRNAVACSIFPAQLEQINSLGPSDAIWRQKTWSTLAQVMAWCRQATSHYLNQC